MRFFPGGGGLDVFFGGGMYGHKERTNEFCLAPLHPFPLFLTHGKGGGDAHPVAVQRAGDARCV